MAPISLPHPPKLLRGIRGSKGRMTVSGLGAWWWSGVGGMAAVSEAGQAREGQAVGALNSLSLSKACEVLFWGLGK